ncbi:hypothetical protein CXG81DRAFT_11334 [Caulochytrium protostelioides]|uniref:EF-hand domain-containing protein n=1 Tax=Caulochytrium protostelioides TaxID=1555241 RepID=A0A4P9WXF2_9FUNG|nr:hypothetical protein CAUPRSCDRAFT_5489 [Caulochytrium protostelioides]RKP01964.1 hypothetical protein CXG81DRAFT_11334 [Caulochytrium protostelioides]|eukprot:RKP01964.1 hypothetical protein CXG81DRAFT_11334 [Caulochytrium protostelioides]
MQLHVGKLAKQLFSALRLNHDDTVLSMECFLPWFPSHEDAQAAFKLFDSDESGEISRKEMREAILKGYRERRALFSSLHNLTSAVAKLDQFFLGITVIITAFASMGIYKVSLASITPFTSLFLAFSFVFSGTLKNVFESVLFFFVSRPFDPYDMVVIDAMLYTVEEMGLMTTLLRAADNKLIYMPNSLLMSKQIQNLQRSTEVAEMVEMTFSIETSESKLRHLRARLFDWVQSQKREFMPYLDMKVIDLPEFKNIKVQFMFKHRGAIHHRRRTDFMFFLRTALIDLNFIADPKEPHAMSPLPPPAVLEPAPVTSNAAQFATASDLVMVSGYT